MPNTDESRRDDWETPDWLFRCVSEVLGPFTVDAAADLNNTKCLQCFKDGLAQDWGIHRVWCNPPYSEIEEWTSKAYRESLTGAYSVLLLPSYTGASWWHRDIPLASQIVFLRAKFPFVGAPYNSPFYCVLVVYDPANEGPPTTEFLDPRPWRDT